MPSTNQCQQWADQGSNQCQQWADQGSNQCQQWADQGSNQCQQWADQGYNKCCDWIPCKWACKALVWVSNMVCQVSIWVSNMVCQVSIWVSKWICIAWSAVDMWLTNASLWLGVHFIRPIKCGIDANSIEKKGWEITFNDEFLGSTLDLNKWRTLPTWTNTSKPFHPGNIIDNGQSPFNYWDASAISISNSILTIETNEIPQTFNFIDWNGVNYGNWKIDYQTAWLETREFNQQYGFFEIRCKIPNSSGAFPAFWLSGDPNPPEIDIMEFFTSNSKKGKSKLMTTIHWLDNKKAKKKKRAINFNICDASNEFNIYGLEWTPNYIKWYFNNRLIRKEVFHMDEFVIPFNVIVNGNMEGYYSNPGVLNDMQLPHKYEVDYVRVYKKV